eukprot:869750-Pyramimonas_sp.AAC.1
MARGAARKILDTVEPEPGMDRREPIFLASLALVSGVPRRLIAPSDPKENDAPGYKQCLELHHACRAKVLG